MARLSGAGFHGVFTDGERLYTINSAPGHIVYGERTLTEGGAEYREWSPTRSKMAAYIKSGGKTDPFRPGGSVLYLGAASGTTASHVADIVAPGQVICVEFSPRSFRDLVQVCEARGNMVPLLADATKPETYSFAADSVDVVYQDVAQKGQASIFLRNFKAFSARRGMLALKARSEDVTGDPDDVIRQASGEIKAAGLKVTDVTRLDPMEKDHAMIAAERA